MKRFIFTIYIIFSGVYAIAQNSWFVDQKNGSDNNSGNSPSAAVQSVDYLTDNNMIQAGDTVFIMGQYNNPSYNPNFIYGGANDRNNPHIWHAENSIKLSGLNGKENQYITFKAYDDNTVLKGDGANILRVYNCSYLRFEGLEIYGEVENIPLSTAEGLETEGLQFLYIDLANTADPQHPTLDEVLYRVQVGTTISEIENTTYPELGSVKRPSYTDTRGLYISGSDHIIIVNNHIHHTPGGGLRVSESSYVKIIGNEINDCSRRSYSGTHALVVTKAVIGTPNSSDDPVSSTIIEKNTVHHNFNEIFSWSPSKTIITPKIDEGKGISLQRNNLQEWIDGNQRILVQNNICYWNGYSGIHSNDGWHIDFVNNTNYMNSYTSTVTNADGEQSGNNIGMSCSGGGDINFINNIALIDTDWGGLAISVAGTDGFTVENNLIYGKNGTTVNRDEDVIGIEQNTIEADPLFTDADNYDFNLENGSPAINSGNTDKAPKDDFYGNQRDNTPDIGAVEYMQPTSIKQVESLNIEVFPNPFTDIIVIKNYTLQKKDIQLYNIAGQDFTRFITVQTGSDTKIMTTNIPKGLYIIKIKGFSQKVYKL